MTTSRQSAGDKRSPCGFGFAEGGHPIAMAADDLFANPTGQRVIVDEEDTRLTLLGHPGNRPRWDVKRRPKHAEGRRSAELTLYADRASVSLDDRADDGKTQPAAFARLFVV